MTEEERIAEVETVVDLLLCRKSRPERSLIVEYVSKVSVAFDISEIEKQRIIRRLEEKHGVQITLGSVLQEQDFEPWLESSKADLDDFYWMRYCSYLAADGKPRQVVAALDHVTDRILGLLENPRKNGPWDRRGMVVGYVQSGKTSNYLGLINKAADAGYRVIIVIAGIHDNLRNQTQERMDDGFIGRDSSSYSSSEWRGGEMTGVGRIDGSRSPVTLTTKSKDFNKNTKLSVGMALSSFSEPVVFVIKKNATTLRNLIDWLKQNASVGGGKIAEPVLVIDDEADNASINTRSRSLQVSKINALIRELLTCFDRSGYVGYTATPFANIFIDPNSNDEMIRQDLFPRHFIVSLDPPSDYVGPVEVFLDNTEEFLRSNEDAYEVFPQKHNRSLGVERLPVSLVDALRLFVLARSVRAARGDGLRHSSMLVNVSPFTDVQNQVRNELHAKLTDIQRSVRANAMKPADRALQDPEMHGLRSLWEVEYSGCGVSWEEVQAQLHRSISPIKVVEINAKSGTTLNYAEHKADGLHVIAVGGYSLSRGLTLEGLIVSYILRNSIMYDTLLQMGRWFGYRPGYKDLTRIWITSQAAEWYAHIAESVETLRDDLRSMEASGGSPENFGLRVRSHPDSLIVTARNKMGTGEKIAVSVGLAGRLIETAAIRADKESLEGNYRNGERLVEDLSRSLGEPEKVPSGYIFRDANSDLILRFLAAYRNHQASPATATDPVANYIRRSQVADLGKWDVFIPSLAKENADGKSIDISGIRVNCRTRRGQFEPSRNRIDITSKGRVGSRGDERVGLTQAQTRAVEMSYVEKKVSATRSGAINYPDRIYRIIERRPLLLLHFLHVETLKAEKEIDRVVLAWGMSFPASEIEEERVEYVVNSRFLEEMNTDAPDDDELEGEDEPK